MSHESSDSVPALSIHKKPATPPLLFRPSPQALLQAARTPPQHLCSAALATRQACVAPPLSPARPLHHHPNSARTASAAATKTKIRRSAAALPASSPAHARLFRFQMRLALLQNRL